MELDDEGRPSCSVGKVVAVKSRSWEVADRGMDLRLAADDEGKVWFIFGEEELPFVGYADAISVPVAELSGVGTPPTPPPP